MPRTSLDCEFLAEIHADTVSTAPLALFGAPQGSRMVFTVTGGTVKGPKLSGTIVGAGGDWLTLRADGTFKLDVRITVQTDDGATILVTYNGIGRQTADGGAELRTAPLFETGDERYAWLNGIQAVGYGTSDATGVHYEVYALT